MMTERQITQNLILYRFILYEYIQYLCVFAEVGFRAKLILSVT